MGGGLCFYVLCLLFAIPNRFNPCARRPSSSVIVILRAYQFICLLICVGVFIGRVCLRLGETEISKPPFSDAIINAYTYLLSMTAFWSSVLCVV